MKGITQMEKHLAFVIKEMCKRVGADPDKINFKKDNWFIEYEWTEKQERKFTDWLAKYLYENSEARRVFATFARKDKKACKRVAEEFVNEYGWKTNYTN